MECTLNGNYGDEDCRTLSCKIYTAKKDHKCEECNRIIKKGEEYEGYNGIHDNYFFWVKTCKDCVSLRNAFYPDGGYLYGAIRDEITEHIIFELHGEVDSKCIVPLTPKAKDFVFEIIKEAWEED